MSTSTFLDLIVATWTDTQTCSTGLAKIHYLAARFYTRKIVNKLTIKLTNNYIHTTDGEDAALPVTAGQGEYLPA